MRGGLGQGVEPRRKRTFGIRLRRVERCEMWQQCLGEKTSQICFVFLAIGFIHRKEMRRKRQNGSQFK